MSTNADDFHELLNGLLDGVLTDDEQRQLDIAMKEDPSLEDRLNELQAMRNSLLRGRSVGRLGPDFSQGVVAAARKRAEMMGDRAPTWLRPPVQRSADRVAKKITPSVPSSVPASVRTAIESREKEPRETSSDVVVSRRAWRVWIPSLAMAVAASLTIYFSVNYFAPRPAITPLVSDIPLVGEIDPADQETNQLAVEMLPNDPAKETAVESPASSIQPGDMESSQLASDEKTMDIRESQPESTATMLESTSNTAIADSTAAMGDLAGVVPDDAQPANPIQDMLQSKGFSDPFFTFVADVSIDPVAQESETLRSLMEQHDIVFADDLDLSQEQLENLISSRMVGTLSNGTESQQSKDVQVLFVRAKASRIDAFLVDIESQYKDFPNFRYDMSVDPVVLQLTKQLSTVATTDDAARRLAFRGTESLGLITAFPAGAREVQYIGIEARKERSKQPGAPKRKLNPREETSYLILLVRNLPPAD